MSFAARRPKPRKISTAQSSDDDDNSEQVRKIVRKKITATSSTTISTVVAPTAAAERPKSKRKAPSSRLSFGGPSIADHYSDEPVFAPKKSALSRKAQERAATRKLGGTVGMRNLNLTPGAERPSYSKAYLAELRAGQIQSEVMEGAAVVEEEDLIMGDRDGEEDMGIAAQSDHGMALAAPSQGAEILDSALVRRLKERRAEKAVAQKLGAEDFISLNARASEESGSEDSSGLRIRRKRKVESRLAVAMDGDDDEIGNYADDLPGGLAQSKVARRTHDRLRRGAIRDAIDAAESGSDSADSAFESEQMRAGAFGAAGTAGSKGLQGELEAIARNPPTIHNELPCMKDVLKGLMAALREGEMRARQTRTAMEMMKDESRGIGGREREVQVRMEEVAARYEKLRIEAGLARAETEGEGVGGVKGVESRGLESFGNTPIKAE